VPLVTVGADWEQEVERFPNPEEVMTGLLPSRTKSIDVSRCGTTSAYIRPCYDTAVASPTEVLHVEPQRLPIIRRLESHPTTRAPRQRATSITPTLAEAN
jgi:hypothetical protein